jgi:hypothetical protein
MSIIRSVGPADAPPAMSMPITVPSARPATARQDGCYARTGASVGRDVSVDERGDVNADHAARVAGAIGISEGSSDGRSERFA